MAEVTKLGSLYLNGKPVPSGVKYNGEQISFGDTVPGTGIPFIKWGNIFVADRCVCTNISWDDLDRCGFIFGRPIRIDGAFYLCRSLKAGTMEGIPNEWNSLLSDLGGDNSLWHWKDYFFWGQETPSKWPSYRSVRGYHSASFWGNYTASIRSEHLGFRPVLEPLPSEPLISEALIGHDLKIYVGNIFVSGRLAGYSDYDLEIVVKKPLPGECPWIRQVKDVVFVNRESIVYIQRRKNLGGNRKTGRLAF